MEEKALPERKGGGEGLSGCRARLLRLGAEAEGGDEAPVGDEAGPPASSPGPWPEADAAVVSAPNSVAPT